METRATEYRIAIRLARERATLNSVLVRNFIGLISSFASIDH
jgi:hypothetical protein